MEKLHSVVHFRIDFKYLTVRNERERERERKTCMEETDGGRDRRTSSENKPLDIKLKQALLMMTGSSPGEYKSRGVISCTTFMGTMLRPA